MTKLLTFLAWLAVIGIFLYAAIGHTPVKVYGPRAQR